MKGFRTLLFVCMMIFLISCNKSDEGVKTADSKQITAKEEGLEDKITVVVYCDDNYPPYSWGEAGEATGIYTDIIEEAFSRMIEYNIIIEAIPWKRGLQELENGTGFAIYPPYYRPKERPYLDYSIPILVEGYDILTRADINMKNRKWPQDYKGMIIGINDGFAIPNKAELREYNIKIEEAKSNEVNILKLVLGRIDCYVNDDIAMLWELKRLKENGIYDEKKYPKLQIGPNLSKESGYLAFTNKNDSKFYFKGDFKKQFNDIIEKMKADGEIEKIVDSYLK